MPQMKRHSQKTEYRLLKTSAAATRRSDGVPGPFISPHPAHNALDWFVNVYWHDYVSCYVYYDSPVFDAYGDIVGYHQANSIYLNPAADHAGEDLLHELGHAVARHFDLVGHRDNYFCNGWEKDQQRLIGAVRHGRHWSQYLNQFAAITNGFQTNAASELWAELFMLYYLYPGLAESELITDTINSLRIDPRFQQMEASLKQARSCWQLPGMPAFPRNYPVK